MDFDALSTPVAASGNETVAEVIVGIFDGISEGGKIIMGMILLLALALFFFGRIAAKRLSLLLDASVEAAREAKAAKDEAKKATTSVTNGHPKHLREDIDGNQIVILQRLDSIAADIGGIRSEIREDRRRVNVLDERLGKYLDGVE